MSTALAECQPKTFKWHISFIALTFSWTMLSDDAIVSLALGNQLDMEMSYSHKLRIIAALSGTAKKRWLGVQLHVPDIQRIMCGTVSYHLSWRPHASSHRASLSRFRQDGGWNIPIIKGGKDSDGDLLLQVLWKSCSYAISLITHVGDQLVSLSQAYLNSKY